MWSAKNLGETTVEEVREGLSYGANTVRDGVSLQRTEVQKPVVSPSEIQQLNNLACYVRLAGPYPITRLTLVPSQREVIQPGLIARPLPSDPLLQDRKKRSASSDNPEWASTPRVENPVYPSQREWALPAFFLNPKEKKTSTSKKSIKSKRILENSPTNTTPIPLPSTVMLPPEKGQLCILEHREKNKREEDEKVKKAKKAIFPVADFLEPNLDADWVGTRRRE